MRACKKQFNKTELDITDALLQNHKFLISIKKKHLV